MKNFTDWGSEDTFSRWVQGQLVCCDIEVEREVVCSEVVNFLSPDLEDRPENPFKPKSYRLDLYLPQINYVIETKLKTSKTLRKRHLNQLNKYLSISGGLGTMLAWDIRKGGEYALSWAGLFGYLASHMPKQSHNLRCRLQYWEAKGLPCSAQDINGLGMAA